MSTGVAQVDDSPCIYEARPVKAPGGARRARAELAYTASPDRRHPGLPSRYQGSATRRSRPSLEPDRRHRPNHAESSSAAAVRHQVLTGRAPAASGRRAIRVAAEDVAGEDGREPDPREVGRQEEGGLSGRSGWCAARGRCSRPAARGSRRCRRRGRMGRGRSQLHPTFSTRFTPSAVAYGRRRSHGQPVECWTGRRGDPGVEDGPRESEQGPRRLERRLPQPSVPGRVHVGGGAACGGGGLAPRRRWGSLLQPLDPPCPRRAWNRPPQALCVPHRAVFGQPGVVPRSAPGEDADVGDTLIRSGSLPSR